MRRRQSVRISIVVICVGLGVVGVRWLALLPHAELARPGHVADSVSAPPLASSPSRPSSSGDSGSTSSDLFAIPARVRTEIARCLSRGPFGALEPATLEALGEAVARGRDSMSGPELLAQNIHVRRTDGTILRLRMTPDESPGRKVRVFSEDREGLPVPEPLPDEFQGLAPRATAERFRALGQVVFESRQTQRSLGRGIEVNQTEQDGHVTELQLIFFEASGVNEAGEAGEHQAAMRRASLGCAWKDLDAALPALECRCF